jgi:hypothetical protein
LWRAGIRAVAELGALKVKQLAYLMGRTSGGKRPGAPIATRSLRHVRFITVESYVRYVLHLAASQRPGELGTPTRSPRSRGWLRQQ